MALQVPFKIFLNTASTTVIVTDNADVVLKTVARNTISVQPVGTDRIRLFLNDSDSYLFSDILDEAGGTYGATRDLAAKALSNLSGFNLGGGGGAVTSVNGDIGIVTVDLDSVLASGINTNKIDNSMLFQMPANTVKLNNTNALADAIDYNLPTDTVLGNFNGNIEALLVEEEIVIRESLTAGVYVYSNPLLTVNSGCKGWSWTGVGSHTSVPLDCIAANGQMTFTTGQVGDTAQFIATIKLFVL